MVFKKMMRAFGVGGPSVDTVLTNPDTRPGRLPRPSGRRPPAAPVGPPRGFVLAPRTARPVS